MFEMIGGFGTVLGVIVVIYILSSIKILLFRARRHFSPGAIAVHGERAWNSACLRAN